MNERACIAFTGGGTGGHVYPGLAVAERLRHDWRGRIVWIGSGKESERSAVAAAGIEFFSVPSGKLRRSFSLRNLLDAFKVLGGVLASLRLLGRLRPTLLFSKGGYVSVPPCLAAAILGIPVFTHESDLTPGLATRINARFAERVLLSWNATLGSLSSSLRRKATITGNPVRQAMFSGNPEKGRAWLGFDDALPIVLVLGGSQGALQVNGLVGAILPSLAGKARVAHQTGPGNPPCRTDDASYRAFEYLREELPDVMAAAAVIVGRAGAGTVWESIAAGKPMVLVPLGGKGSRGDQVENARMLADAGAAVCLAGPEATPQALLDALDSLLENPASGKRMASSAAALASRDAAGSIASMLAKRADAAEGKTV